MTSRTAAVALLAALISRRASSRRASGGCAAKRTRRTASYQPGQIEVGGPGFAKAPVYRWNGTTYARPN